MWNTRLRHDVMEWHHYMTWHHCMTWHDMTWHGMKRHAMSFWLAPETTENEGSFLFGVCLRFWIMDYQWWDAIVKSNGILGTMVDHLLGEAWNQERWLWLNFENSRYKISIIYDFAFRVFHHFASIFLKSPMYWKFVDWHHKGPEMMITI